MVGRGARSAPPRTSSLPIGEPFVAGIGRLAGAGGLDLRRPRQRRSLYNRARARSVSVAVRGRGVESGGDSFHVGMPSMKFGFVIPEGLDVHAIVDFAEMAEAAGWDGFFNWDGSYFDEPRPLYDAWLVLTAIAARTRRIRIGALLFALYRRKPWEVAREAVTLDHLSNGRLVMPVGLGAVEAHGNGRFGLSIDRRTRAELLDESLTVLTGLWRGEPFSFAGRHYQLDEVTFLPVPLQRPRIPIWTVGLWPSQRSMARAFRYDGVIAAKQSAPGQFEALQPAEVREIGAAAAEQRRTDEPFNIIVEGRSSADDRATAAAQVRLFADAGATWWIETMWTAPNDPAAVRARLLAGPPRAD